jgi:drug/metabolite transporter (DMT)-like permease
MEENKVENLSAQGEKNNKGPWQIAVAAMMWATDAPFRVKLLAHLKSEVLVLYEHLVNTILVFPLMIKHRREIAGITAREWLALIAVGLGGSAFALVLFSSAFAFTNPSVVILLQKLQPIIATILAVIILRERVSKTFFAIAIAMLVGAWFISFPAGMPDFGVDGFPHAVKGALLALGAATLWGASTVFGKYALKRQSFQIVTALRFAIGFVGLLVYLLIVKIPFLVHLTAKDILFIVIVSIVSGAVALFIYYRGLVSTKASYATFIEVVGYPIGSVALNWIFLGAKLSAMQILGTAVLLGALIFLSKIHRKENLTSPLAPLPSTGEGKNQNLK